MSKVIPSGRTAVKRIRQVAAHHPLRYRQASSKPPNRPQENTIDKDTLSSNRRIIWTAGIAVIAAAGAILGAQLKTWSEPIEERQVHPIAPTPSGPLSSEVTLSEQKSKTFSANKTSGNNIIAQQIAALETTKGSLQFQKARLQEKIDRLRERRRQKEDMEAKRKINVNR